MNFTRNFVVKITNTQVAASVTELFVSEDVLHHFVESTILGLALPY